MVNNINHAQDFLGRRLLIENPSAYIGFKEQEYTETEFLNGLCKTTGCGVLLDLNNVVVSSHNLGHDPTAYIREIHPNHVGQYHLAGHVQREGLCIDTHSSAVLDSVWSLYDEALLLFGDQPAMIEWDSDVPSLQALVDEAHKAKDRAAFILKGEGYDSQLSA